MSACLCFDTTLVREQHFIYGRRTTASILSRRILSYPTLYYPFLSHLPTYLPTNLQLTSDIEIELLRARYILVVEKECVFSRLLDDGIVDLAGGMIVITGKGR